MLVPYRTITRACGTQRYHYMLISTRKQKELNNEAGNVVLAAGVRDGLAPMAQGQSTPPQPKITGVLTILTPKPGVTVEQVMKIMPAEIRATVPLYLDGKIQQWFTRGDGRGVIFILNCKDVAEARALIESLPLSKETSWTSSSFRSGHSWRWAYC